MLDSEGTRTQKAFAALALAVTLFCLWSLTYEYRGLAYDAQIYAVQALGKLRPSLFADLFLQNVSQDQFTIFPRLYAWVIKFVGLRPAALLLTIVFTLWLLSAAWGVMKTLANRELAWLATSLLVILAGGYGAFDVFYIAEPFLTARLPAEALLATALACYFRGYPRIALVIAFAALFVHPLMAFPGLLLLICLRLPPRATVVAASIGIIGTLVAAIAASNLPSVGRILTVMDAPWIDVVQERSQFLFLQLWTARDWALNARPFVSLAFAAMIFRTGDARNLAVGAIVVGATGIAIAAIASLIGPVALLMQGQAWRWVWITTFVSILLLLPTAYEAWQDDKCGPVCAILLIAGWLMPVEAGVACASLALPVWMLRSKISPSWPKYGPLAGAVIVLGTVWWSLMDSWAIVSKMPAVPSSESFLVAGVRALFALKVWCVLFVGVLWGGIRSSSGALLPGAIIVVLGASAASLQFQSSAHLRPYGSASDIGEFTEWRDRIPAESTVFVTNGYDSGSFVWFTLQRNNYLSSGQSAGVVFSRATALEVQRRSEVLLPLGDPNWKMLTSLRNRKGVAPRSVASGSAQSFRRLTAQALVAVCHDPLLGFVVSPDDVGFDPIPHTHPGMWKNWKLYDCNHVRAQVPAA
jgi:hypothetical protein